MLVYADNAATTKMSRTAIDAMDAAMENNWGNPSSLHDIGQHAKEALESARATMAKYLNAQTNEIYFTSGGSEADNQALLSAAELGGKQGKKHIVSTKFEHHAILRTLDLLRQRGFEVTLLDVHENGIVTPEQVAQAIRPDTCLVSVMYANNEIGSIQPIEQIGAVCRAKGILFHTDAVQAAGHLPIDVKKENIDMLSVSAHKFRGPKGVGILYARRGVLLQPLIRGGEQERNKRAGTENLPGILSMAAAFREACEHLDENSARVSAMRDKVIDALLRIPHTVLNGDRTRRLPGNCNFCFEGIEGESILLLLNEQGICASSGSACASGSLEPSHVLLAIGRPAEIAHGSLRLTFNEENTDEQIEHVIRAVPQVIENLREMSPVWRDLQEGKLQYALQ
jgi:cysteine desulfurase